MTCTAPSILANERNWDLSPEYLQPHWYAAYTCANHEKRVADQLSQSGMQHFLPLYSSIRRWKDRRVRLSLPLFPGYLFVFLALRDRLQLLQLPGVARLVTFNGRPAPLPEEQIEGLRRGLAQMHAEPHLGLTAGRRVRIIFGPLRGAEGILQRRKNSCRVVLSVELIMRFLAVEVDLADLELLAA